MKAIFRFCLVMALALPGAALAAAQSAEGIQKNEFKKWLDEEVRWIISRRGLQEAKKLKTDQERALFLKRFWEERDPSPGTEKHEYKEEHYRRLAYANQEFKENGPGWRSDRGRVYIIHGPPPARNRLPNREVWTYPSNPNAEYYKGAITLIFDQGASVFQERLLSDSRAARSRNVPGSGVSPNDIVSSVGAPGKYRLINAAPASLLSAAAATRDSLPTDLGETDRYIADILRPPGEVLEEAKRDRERRRKTFAEARAEAAQVSFEGLRPELTSHLFRSGDGARVFFGVSVASSQLTYLSEEERAAGQGQGRKRKKKQEKAGQPQAPRQAKVDLLCEISDQLSGYKVDSLDDTYFLAEGQPLAVAQLFNVPEGKFDLMCLVRDASSQKMGTGNLSIGAPPLEGNQLGMSSVLLTQSLEQISPGVSGPLVFQNVRFQPPSTRNIDPRMHALLYFQVYNCLQPSGQLRRMSYDYVIQSGGEVLQTAAERPLPSDQIADGTLSHALRLNLTSLEAGDYTLQLRIKEAASGSTVTRSAAFRILGN
ncbi:MAG: GWxTD domain-containing protein [Acidobacteriota bacterium]